MLYGGGGGGGGGGNGGGRAAPKMGVFRNELSALVYGLPLAAPNAAASTADSEVRNGLMIFIFVAKSLPTLPHAGRCLRALFLLLLLVLVFLYLFLLLLHMLSLPLTLSVLILLFYVGFKSVGEEDIDLFRVLAVDVRVYVAKCYIVPSAI